MCIQIVYPCAAPRAPGRSVANRNVQAQSSRDDTSFLKINGYSPRVFFSLLPAFFNVNFLIPMAKYYKCSLVKTFTGQRFNINSLLSLYLVSLFCKTAVKIQVTKSKIRPRRGSISLFVTCIFTATLQKG